MSLVMKYVEAASLDEEQRMDAAAASLDGVNARVVFDALGKFGGFIVPNLKPEQLDVIREELGAANGAPEVQAAVRDIGTLLLVTPNLPEAYQTIIRHGPAIRALGDGGWPLVVTLTLRAAGRAFGRLKITMTWT
jgi:hypothetical protein